MLTFTPPPNWPPAPEGFVPPPGWSPDPSWPPPPPGWMFWQQRKHVWALDRAVAESPDTGWSIWLGLAPMLALIVVIAGVAALGTALHGWRPSELTRWFLLPVEVLHYAAALVVIVIMGRTVRRTSGGWQRAFGWGKVKLIDPLLGIGGAVAEFIARIAVGLVLFILIPALRGKTEANVSLHGKSTTAIVLILILAVLIAPPIEELIFRGVMLRAFMKRLPATRLGPFWPAAILSSFLFAALHLYEVHSIAAMVLLFASIFTFAIGQCLLLRWTGRLATTISAHAVSNLAAALLTLATNK
ncbi:MAG TPA: CPBP family intramembrane glutamic endopeptidase [Jatrophihabitans sp.]|nr:CPBP family intramembrane glutamic endopeptidase [Jatrophihabitans sp.]